MLEQGLKYLIHYITQAITLKPGDVIAAGTPEGVGVFRKPPVLLKDGDVFDVVIEGLGTLRNTFRPAGAGISKHALSHSFIPAILKNGLQAYRHPLSLSEAIQPEKILRNRDGIFRKLSR
ncbi:MAG: fumarylacetoacetate hydrolase family protein [Blastocatellia bacterium]